MDLVPSLDQIKDRLPSLYKKMDVPLSRNLSYIVRGKQLWELKPPSPLTAEIHSKLAEAIGEAQRTSHGARA